MSLRRYVELEKRFLQMAAERHFNVNQGIVLPGGFEILMMNLIDDGLVIRYANSGTIGSGSAAFPIAVHDLLTKKVTP